MYQPKPKTFKRNSSENIAKNTSLAVVIHYRSVVAVISKIITAILTVVIKNIRLEKSGDVTISNIL